MFAIRVETGTLPELHTMVQTMKRSAERAGKLPPAKKMLRSLSRVPIVSQYGDLVRVARTVDAQAERILAGLSWIVRGLYYHHQEEVLDPNSEYQWWAYAGTENKEKFDAIWPTPDYDGPFNVGACLAYKVGFCPEVPGYSDWLLVFYGRLFFIITTNARQLIEMGNAP